MKINDLNQCIMSYVKKLQFINCKHKNEENKGKGGGGIDHYYKNSDFMRYEYPRKIYKYL